MNLDAPGKPITACVFGGAGVLVGLGACSCIIRQGSNRAPAGGVSIALRAWRKAVRGAKIVIADLQRAYDRA